MEDQLKDGKKDEIDTEYCFWKYQPISNSNKLKEGPITIEIKIENIRKIPYDLPDEFRWCVLNLFESDHKQHEEKMTAEEVIKHVNTGHKDLDDLYMFLRRNYVEDSNSVFRFDYSPKFIKWALLPPKWKQDWHIGIRTKESEKLVGFISAIPCKLKIDNKDVKCVSVNFLCVHKNLRLKRLAPIMIKEITRRVNLDGIFYGFFTGGMKLFQPILTTSYYHRPINFIKLTETGFCSNEVYSEFNLKLVQEIYKIPRKIQTKNLFPLKEEDIEQTLALLNRYLSKFKLSQTFDLNSMKHWFVGDPQIINSFVVKNGNIVTDFISFYIIRSSVINNPKHKSLDIAYLFYYAPSSISMLKHLVEDMLVIAKERGCDVFNCINNMDNPSFIDSLSFGPGDSKLYYYLFNWHMYNTSPRNTAITIF